MSPNLHSGRFLIEEAVILEQSWREGKSNFELRVPLENAATITDPPIVSIPETMATTRPKLGKTALMIKSAAILKFRIPV